MTERRPLLQHLSYPLLVLLLCLPIAINAQRIRPITHFYPLDSLAARYLPTYFSGFMQTTTADTLRGFLQMPFVGEPRLVYRGEKDSTQFTAYASAYQHLTHDSLTSTYGVDLTRYGVHTQLQLYPDYVVQQIYYPDTLADKGFLIDIDHADSPLGPDEMNVHFLDKRRIYAYKRQASTSDSPSAPIYYYARFSHPFTTWNIRRERVTLNDGRKATRCKAAFTFKLAPGEVLTVESAVSTHSREAAAARIEQRPYRASSRPTAAHVVRSETPHHFFLP